MFLHISFTICKSIFNALPTSLIEPLSLTVLKVTISEQYRPDVIANNAYGDPNLAWVILSANGLSDIFDLVAEMEIRIPSSLSIYNMGGVLNR